MALVLLLSIWTILPVRSPGAQGEDKSPIPLGPGVAAENVTDPFDYFTNSWTVIGLKNHPRGTRITPGGELVLSGGLLCRPLVGEGLYPLNNRIKKTLQAGHLPIVRSDFVVNRAVRYTLEALACPLEKKGSFDQPRGGNYLNDLRVTFKNITSVPQRAHFGLQWLPEQKCEIRETSRGGELSVISGEKNLCALRIPEGAKLSARGSRIHLELTLEGKAPASAVLSIPFIPAAVPSLDFDNQSTRARLFWENLLSGGARISLPEEKPLHTYLASLVYQFIGQDNGELHAGEGFYDEIYLRDGAYQAISLAQAGYLEECRKSLETFLRFQKESGQFESQKGQLDAHGYAIWALVEYFRLTGDLEWLRRMYPRIERAADWIKKERRREEDPASPFHGILPRAVADGEYLWAGKNHIVGYDWQNLRGIQSAAEAARILGKTKEAESLEREFREYRRCILEALEKTGLPYIPPSYEGEGTHWGNLEAVFPSILIDPRDARLTATLAHVRNDFGSIQGENGGFLEGTIQWSPPHRGAIHPYMSQFVTNTYIIRGDQAEAIDGFYSFLLHTTSTHGFPEGVYYRRREAWGNTLPHLWAAALYVTTLRNMLVREEGKDLHLLSAVPPHWLDPGKEVQFLGAPTHFGTISLAAAGLENGIRISITPPDRIVPDRITIHLPPEMEIRSVEAEGKTLPLEDPRRISLGGDRYRRPFRVLLNVRRAAPDRVVNFASKVAGYEASVRDLLKPIPDILPQPPGDVDERDCKKLDLAPLANTDPLSAPFGVPNAATLRGLPLGDQKVGGIPFHIIDPAKNQGKGLIVLRGANSCAAFPEEISIPAGGRGRYLCILGNVTGWSPGDPGIGKWGAVCVHEIHYGDGSIQKIPLISGRTADDWLQSPAAADVTVGLKGDPWHLNLLTVRLRPKPVDRVVVRDLGTPASPVVAAMTIVR